MAKIPSGLSEVDKFLGGLEKGQVYLLLGGTGTGKTALSLIFLVEGLKRGEPGLLVTSDFPEDIFSFGEDFLKVNFLDYVQQGKLALLEYPLGVEEYRNPVLNFELDDVFIELKRHCDEIFPSRVVIDSLSPCLTFSANREALDFARSVILGLKSLGTTTLVTGDPEGEASFREAYNALERLAYGVLEVRAQAVPGMPYVRNLSIRKLKDEIPEKSSFYFALKSEAGAVFMEKLPVAAPAPEEAKAVPGTGVAEVIAGVPHFSEVLARELSRATRYNRPLSLVVLSLEEFKLGRGPRATEESQKTLDLFHRVLVETGRDSDVMSRFSWDRFIALLPETSAPNAVRFVHRTEANLEKALRKEGLYEGQEIPAIKHGVGEHPGDTGQGEDLVAVALGRLR